MKLNISKETYEEKWVDFEDCKLLLKPYPVGKNDIVMTTNLEMTVSGEQRKKIFMYSLKGWKGIIDSNDNDLAFSDANKELIYDYNLGGIAGFVYHYNISFESGLREELENLQSGQDGNSTD